MSLLVCAIQHITLSQLSLCFTQGKIKLGEFTMRALTVKLACVIAVGLTISVMNPGNSMAKVVKDVSNERGHDIFASCMLDDGKVNTRSDGSIACCTKRYCVKCPEGRSDKNCRFYEEARRPGNNNRPSAPETGKLTQPTPPKKIWKQQRPRIYNSGNGSSTILR
jgi:hypothetical protein